MFHAFCALSCDHKFICFRIIDSKSLDALAITTVMKLGQTKTPDVFTIYRPIVEFHMQRVGLVQQ